MEDETAQSNTAVDTTPPIVTSSDPKNNAVNVPASKVFKVTFSENITSGSGKIELLNSGGNSIPITPSISGKVLTIKPKSKLAESLYSLKIHTGAVKDFANNPAAYKTIKFSVGTSPAFASSNPVNGAINVVTSKKITVTFSEAIKKGNFWIEFKDSKGTPFKINASIKGKVLTITHPKSLKSNTGYILTLHSGCVSDLAGNPSVLKTISFTSIHILDSSVGGNVLANKEISRNIPKTDFSKDIFEMVKQGSVVLKFGSGNGTKLLISAGIHGNEPEANIAVMKYLEYIKNKNLKGTLYVIPFAIPQSTAQNTRKYKGKDPNRTANVKGTPGWNIVKFAQNNGINYLLDVHSGAEVGKYGYVYLNSASNTKEKNWASYIKSKTGCTSTVNDAESPGMIRSFAHSLGINTITLEVERDTIPTVKAAETEYKMVKAATEKLGFDTTPPIVKSSDPKNKANNIARSKTIRLTFNEYVKAGSKYKTVVLVDSKGEKISINKSIKGKVLTITHTKLKAKAKYTLKLYANSITDKAGNPLKYKTITFTTGTK